MSKTDTTLYYIHDPMCSWCWGFRKVRDEVFDAVKEQVKIEYVLGGLAPDSDSTMPMDMQQSIRANWQRIQQEIPGTEFNYDFWTKCQPRRSTYPACRAVIAAGMQQEDIEQKRSGKDMVLAIQQAYYLNAKNPSDLVTLGQLAENMGLDLQQFLTDIQSERCQEKLLKQLAFCRDMGVYSFPSLLVKRPEAQASLLQIDYNDSQKVIDQIILC